MDILKNKQYIAFDYTSRYTGVPFYFNTQDNREIFGIGSNLNKNTPWVAHIITPEDTLDKLALKYYNNPTYWWIIAYFNDIQDPFIQLYSWGNNIKIPSIGSIEFGAER